MVSTLGQRQEKRVIGPRRAARWAVIALGLAAVGCRTQRIAPISLPESVRRMQGALEAGQIEDALQYRDQAVKWWGRDPVVRQWAATVSMAVWDFGDALAQLRQARQFLAAAGGAVADLDVRIGEMLFFMGRYEECVPWLESAGDGPAGSRPRALARLARELPQVRWSLGQGSAAELPLLPGPLPQIVCSSSERRRTFVLDTGSTVSAVGRRVAAELAVSPVLPVGDATDGAGRRFVADIGLLPNFALGEVGLGSQPVLVVSDDRMALRSEVGGEAYPVAGVVGLDVLHRLRLTLDPLRESVIFEVPRGLGRLGALRCLWSGSNGVLVPIVVEGATLWFKLDTGASHSSLTVEGMNALPDGRRRAVPNPRRIRGVGGVQMAVQEVRNLDLLLSEVRFRGVDLPVVDRVRGGYLPVHGVLGADLILKCRITLDSGFVRVELP